MESTALLNENMEFRRNLNMLRQTGTFCDATICIPGEAKTLPVHRAVMSTCSEFFRSLFTNDMKETNENKAVIHGISYNLMETLIEYAYTKDVAITHETAEELFIAADRFNVLGLLQDCIDFFAVHLSADNCISFWRFSRFYNNKELKDLCWVYIMLHFTDLVTNSIEFVQLTEEELQEIVSSDTLRVESEDQVFDAVMKWSEYSPRDRRDARNNLFGAVRFAYVTEDCFRNRIVNRRDLKRGPCWKRISLAFNLVKRFRPSTERRVKSRTIELARYIKPRVPSHVLFVLGGWDKNVTDSIEAYDKNTDQWFEIKSCDLPEPRAYHGAVAIRDKVYVLGGYNNLTYLNSVICFNASMKKWESKQSMCMARCYVSVTELAGSIYACGGFDGVQRHNSAEKYDFERNQWSLVRPMFHKRSDAGATCSGGKMYIAGGFNGMSCLSSAEMYDPVANQWTILTSMSVLRSGVSMVTCDGRVFAIGGFDGERRLASVEYYDSVARAWLPDVSMLLGRSNFSCVVMDKKIYAIGGYDGEQTSPKVECFCPKVKHWHPVNDMLVGRSALSACTVTDIHNARDFSFHGNTEESHNDILAGPSSEEENLKIVKTLAMWKKASKL